MGSPGFALAGSWGGDTGCLGWVVLAVGAGGVVGLVGGWAAGALGVVGLGGVGILALVGDWLGGTDLAIGGWADFAGDVLAAGGRFESLGELVASAAGGAGGAFENGSPDPPGCPGALDRATTTGPCSRLKGFRHRGSSTGVA